METTRALTKTGGITETGLKWIALVTMVMDHIHYFFGFTGMIPEWFSMVGRLGAPLFLFCLVEGFTHTHSRKKYFAKVYILSAAKAACCHDFIMALPNGYDTVIGEGGSTLSGGEKQRISIARAILKDAPIVILDEATASVDPENEHLIQQAISALTRGKTIITIAHRLATVQNADQILVVDDGRIAQHGTHDQLVKQEGLYRRFTAIRQQAEGWRIAAE